MTSIQNTVYSAQAQSMSRVLPDYSQRIERKSLEAFEGETKLLKELYRNYIQNVGGYEYKDGQWIHVTTVLHVNKSAQNALFAIRNRLIELGELPQSNVQRGDVQIIY